MRSLFSRITTLRGGCLGVLAPSTQLQRPTSSLFSSSPSSINSDSPVSSFSSRRWNSGGSHDYEVPERKGRELDQKGLKALREGRPHEAIQAWSEMLDNIDAKLELLQKKEGLTKPTEGDGDKIELSPEEKIRAEKMEKARTMARLGPLNNLSCAFGAIGDRWRQTEILKEVLEVSRQSYGNQHQQCAVALYNLAEAAGGIGRYKEMEKYLKESIIITAKNFHPRHAKVGRCMILLAECMEGQERFEVQANLLSDAEAIVEKHVGKNHHQWAVTMGKKARALGLAKKVPETKETCQKLFDQMERTDSDWDPSTAIVARDLAEGYGLIGEHRKQLRLLQDVLKIQRKHFGSDDTEQIATYIQISKCYAALGQNEEEDEDLLSHAALSAERALAIATGKYPEHHVDVGRAYAQAALTRQEDDIALEASKKAIECLGWYYKDAEVPMRVLTDVKQRHDALVAAGAELPISVEVDGRQGGGGGPPREEK